MNPTNLPINMDKFPNQFPLNSFEGVILGITGLAGSGKDTFASMLIEQIVKMIPIEGVVSVDQYARPLKEAYVAKWGKVLNFTYEDTNDFKWKKQINPFTNTTHREEFQFDGTEGTRVRTGNPNTWVQHLWARNWTNSGFLVVPDTRFDNEKDFTLLNGVLIKVRRPDQEVIATNGHSSENIPSDDDCDYLVDNDGTLGDLQSAAYNLAHSLIVVTNLKDTCRGLQSPPKYQFSRYKKDLLTDMAEKRGYVKKLTEFNLTTISTNA
jgi:hypothetical protein